MKKLGLCIVAIGAIQLNASPRYRNIYLTCENPGSHQDVAKTPVITNTTGHIINATTKVYWKATDGDHGFVQGPFAINESKTALGNPGNGYQCEAWYQVPLNSLTPLPH